MSSINYQQKLNDNHVINFWYVNKNVIMIWKTVYLLYYNIYPMDVS